MKGIVKYIAAAGLFASLAVSDSTSFTIHVIGDSTVCNYKDSAYPQKGWGQTLNNFFDASRVKVNNVAIGGRSSKKFIADGRLKSLEPSIQKGDFVFVQFGHNDRTANKADRYVPQDSFPYYMKQYITTAQKHGATPVMVSTVTMSGSRNVFSTGAKNYDSRGMMLKLAKDYKIPFVDLNMKSYNTYNNTYKGMMDSYVKKFLYMQLDAGLYPNYPNGSNDGNTHFQEMGSMGHGTMIAEELERGVNDDFLSPESKAELTKLVSALRPRYKVTVKANINTRGAITQNQMFPGGSPMTLRVVPASGETFEYWADENCKKISSNKLYYGFKTPNHNTTYTAMFKGGAACVATPVQEDPVVSSSSVAPSSSSEAESSSSAEVACSNLKGVSLWPSPIDMANPDEGDGTTDTNHEGFVGQGFFNLTNSTTSTATYKLTSDRSATNARLMVRYAFDGTENRDMKIKIDAITYDVSLPPTGGWNVWDTAYVEDVWLDAVDFDLVLYSTTANGGPNVDMVSFTNEAVHRVGCPVAEVVKDTSTAKEPGKGDSTTAIVNARAAKASFNVKNLTLTSAGGTAKIQIMSALGKTVVNETRTLPAGEANLLQTQLPAGRYFVKVILNGSLAVRAPVTIGKTIQ